MRARDGDEEAEGQRGREAERLRDTRDTETQRHRDTRTQRLRDTRDSETQRFRDTETRRHRDSETQRASCSVLPPRWMRSGCLLKYL